MSAALDAQGRTLVMGILNVTPDSFSDGGEWYDRDDAVRHGLDMVAQGADIIDVGGESTRPGARRVDPAVERRRVIPVVQALAADGVAVSVDTMNASTAAAAIDAGAVLVNDVSGGLADPAMDALVAESRIRFVVMHWRGHSDVMTQHATYTDVVTEVSDALRRRMDGLVSAGVDPAQLIVDPGLGFAKDAGHNWELLARLADLRALGAPVLVGASRKRFLGALDGAAPGDRGVASAVVAAFAARAGAWAVRVHHVPSTRSALAVESALRAASAPLRLVADVRPAPLQGGGAPAQRGADAPPQHEPASPVPGPAHEPASPAPAPADDGRTLDA